MNVLKAKDRFDDSNTRIRHERQEINDYNVEATTRCGVVAPLLVPTAVVQTTR